jgi:hypothetical protein
MLETYWPNFSKLSPNSRQRWETGAWLLTTKAEHSAGLAAHCFAGVIERELREAIFESFKESTKGNDLASGADETTSPFVLYLRGKAPITLRQMFTVLKQARRPSTGIVKSFATWIAAEAPWLLVRFEGVQADLIARLRNREDHFDPRNITAAEAEVMGRECRELLAALFQRRA